MKERDAPIILPVLPLRNAVVFPGSNVSFTVGRDFSVNAVEAAMEHFDRHLVTVTQKNSMRENPDHDTFYEVGVIADILQVVEQPDGLLEVFIDGVSRVNLREIGTEDGYFFCRCTPRTDPDADSPEVSNYRDILETLLFEFAGDGEIAEPVLHESFSIEDASEFLDFIIATFPGIDTDGKQNVLSAATLSKRYQLVISLLKIEREMHALEKRIDRDVRTKMEQTQKEYYIHEQIHALRQELGDNDGDEYVPEDDLERRIRGFKGPSHVRRRIKKEYERLRKLPPVSSESGVITSYLEILLSIPWHDNTDSVIDIKKARRVLETDHFGLEKVKQRVLEYIAVLKLKNGAPGPQILCFAGPPGVGKTSVAASVATALGRTFVRQALGGIKDEAEIRGHRRTYIGAMPGRITKSVIKAGVGDPVILLDEIDKLGNDVRGDPASALLEVLDPEQNAHFTDHYIDLEMDLSDVLFIATANDVSQIPPTLRDRLEIIEIDGYTSWEKDHIARKYLLPKQKKRNGLAVPVRITGDGLSSLLHDYTAEAGVRELERVISSLCRKIAFKTLYAPEDRKAYVITKNNVGSYLGPRKYETDRCDTASIIGVANGLAWTSAGGKLLKIEATRFPGDGNVKITGHLGDIMKESVSTAVSFVRSIPQTLFPIERSVWKEYDIHLHFPEGAVPKDGPSAGVAIAIAVASVVSERPVRPGIGVTGETTLRGQVLKIGGLRAKIMAAKNAGIRTIIIPEANAGDLAELPDGMKEGLDISTATDARSVIIGALERVSAGRGLQNEKSKSHAIQ